MKYLIYHNPRCSKSREALALLQEGGKDLEINEYINEKLSLTELKNILKMGNLKASDIVRSKDDAFKELNIELSNSEKILKAIVENPKLLERPIVVHNNKAIIARPPERVKEFK